MLGRRWLNGMHCCLPCGEIEALRAIAGGIDIGLVRLHVVIHYNPLVHLDITTLKVVDPRFYAGRHDHNICRADLTALQHHLQFISCRFDCLHLSIGVYRDPFRLTP